MSRLPGLTGRLFLPHGWTLNGNYRYTTTTAPDPGRAVPLNAHPFHRLDVTVSKEILDGHGELMFGVADILNKTNHPVFGAGQFTAEETPGRTFFVRLQLKF